MCNTFVPPFPLLPQLPSRFHLVSFLLMSTTLASISLPFSPNNSNFCSSHQAISACQAYATNENNLAGVRRITEKESWFTDVLQWFLFNFRLTVCSLEDGLIWTDGKGMESVLTQLKKKKIRCTFRIEWLNFYHQLI